MKHFFTTLLLALCATLTAAAQTATIGGINYEVNDDNTTCSVTESPNAKGDVTIPASVTIDGKSYSVTAIGKEAFFFCDYDALTSIKLPSSVTTIGDDAFSGCNALTSINIPSSVTTIGDQAFSYCSALTSINIPSSVTTIGEGAFYKCYALTSISIPSSVTTIGESAFCKCQALTSIDIPSSVTTIGNGAFDDCISLTSINVANDNPVYCSVGGALFSKDKKTLCCCPAGTTGHYAPPQGVTTIGEGAFCDCALTSISIPNGVTTIGERAFCECYALTSISIPASITTISDFAFSYCYALTSINIPSSVTTIGEGAFCECYALTSINIPTSVTTIGESPFEDCSALTNINCYAKTPPAISDDPFFPDGVTVHVPKGCAQAYRQAKFWKNRTIEDDL